MRTTLITLRFFGKRTSTVVTMDVRDKDAAWHELP